jgi:hypothetical protein
MCVLGVSANAERRSSSVTAVPVHFRNFGLELHCLVPRWADAAYYLEQNPEVLLIIQSQAAPELGWLQYRGDAIIIPNPDWSELLPSGTSQSGPEARYLAFHIRPSRIDLIDETEGWGVIASLEF